VLPPRYVRIANAMRSRLRTEIRDQERKATTNLVMGLLTALLGIGFLGWLAYDTSHVFRTARDLAPAVAMNPMAYWGQFAAKAALSISANLFSLFFLSTYRRTLTEIRYFQNELTNAEAHLVALFFSEDWGYADTQKKLLLRLSVEERNILLRRGESTADLELKRLVADEAAAAMALAARIADGLGPDDKRAAKPSVRRRER
jgi:hypothetical protein